MRFLSKMLLLLPFFFVNYMANAQDQNLVNMDSWVDGTSGQAPPYYLQGTVAQNSRVTINGPYGQDVVVWQALSDGSSTYNGGFSHGGITLDTSKSYRITFWMRSSGPNNCTNYAGFVPYRGSDGSHIASMERVDATNVAWPYIYSAPLPNDKWYLVVGYIRPNNYSGGILGGVYDPQTIDGNNPTVLPAPSFSASDFKFPTTENTINIRIRKLQWACSSGEYLYTYDPRVEELNGQEIPMIELLGGSSTPPPGGGDTVWDVIGNDINYTSGHVGIGTTAQSGYELAVDGKIHTKEVKVDDIGWADYVFETDYKLPSLEEVERHITEKGHLINIPSAEEVEANGILLGEMNRLLLEKIEELTLYILEQEKRITELESKK